MNAKTIKILSSIVPVASLALSLLSSYLGKKELDEQIATKVSEALAKH